MLGIDNCGDASCFLSLGDGVDGKSGFTRRFRPENLDDTSAGKTAHPEREVKTYRAGGDNFHILHYLVTEFHDCASAEVLLNLSHSLREGVEL